MGVTIKKFPMYYGGTKQPFSRSVITGNLMFCTGMDGSDIETGRICSANIENQTIIALDKVKDALNEAGTNLNNIVRTVILLNSMTDYQRFREAETKYYQQHAPHLVNEPPVSKVIEYKSHSKAEVLVEIDVTAVISRDMPGWEVKTYPLSYAGVQQPYAKATIVGNLIYLAGIDGRNFETGQVTSNNIRKQMWAALENVKSTLRGLGTTMDSIVDTVMLLTDLKNYASMRETESEFLQSHARRLVDDPPASTFIKTASLAAPECLVEIQATAVLSQDRPGWKVTKYPEWCGGKRLVIPWFDAGMPHLSKAVVVGDFILGGGCSARTAASEATIGTTISEQMKVTLGVIKDTIEDAGGDMENIIQTFIMLKDINDYHLMREAEIEFYRQYAPRLVVEPPVSTVIQPHALARPDYLIEMNALSVITR